MQKPAEKSQVTARGGKGDAKFQNLVQKILNDKDSVNKFFDGEISIDELHARGIRFIKAL
jgi:hypothetical protein